MNVNSSLQLALDNFCRQFGIGVLTFLNDYRAFTKSEETVTKIGQLPIYLHRLANPPFGLYVAKQSPVFRITRGGCHQPGSLNRPTSTLVPDPKYRRHYSPVLFTRIEKTESGLQGETCEVKTLSDSRDERFVYQSLVLLDGGSFDGVHRILFATSANSLWINAMLLMDSITYLSKGLLHSSAPASIRLDDEDVRVMQDASSPKLAVPVDTGRWLAIDVDDVFLGSSLLKQDVEEMIAAQRRWREFVPDFSFNLGFCGQNLERSRYLANGADIDYLLAHKHEFYWFGHTWNHAHAHSADEEELVQSMQRNKEIAEKYGLPISAGYSVSPFHDGIFPVYPPLYNAWRRVWNISVSSTYEYTPLVNSVRQPMGFTTHGIQVIPRRMCGIFSRTVRMADFPGGIVAMREFVRSHMLSTLLLHPTVIFMTHSPNYRVHRLAIQLFDMTFAFTRSWTNLQLRWAPPTAMARIYSRRFQSLGANSLPLHMDPCSHRNKANLWYSQRPCGPKVLPQLIILGPQKTGSTALEEFLRLHPLMTANRFHGTGHFEEIQFFSDDRLYSRGSEYYMAQFSDSSLAENGMHFEKSATYFAPSKKIAPRIQALVPDVKLIVILSNPVERAYSWYQHEVGHNSHPGRSFSFVNLLNFTADRSDSKASLTQHADQLAASVNRSSNTTHGQELASQIHRLLSRCIEPGRYAVHLRTWLDHFSSSQMLIVDGEQLRSQPAVVLHAVQEFLGLPVKLNFSGLLEYNARKGFHCLTSAVHFPPWPMRNHTQTACLGVSKGHRYQRLQPVVVQELMRLHYSADNQDLRTLLRGQPVWRQWLLRMGREYPSWLSSG